MPTKLEWQAAGAVLLFLLIWLPWGLIFDFLSKVRRTWSGKREQAERPDRLVTR
jgi:hypothetical protein